MRTGLVAIVCLLMAAVSAAQERQSPPLRFTLTDTYGRTVSSSDYEGSPVLIVFGSCW